MELPFHFVRPRVFADDLGREEASASAGGSVYVVYSRKRRRSSLVADFDRLSAQDSESKVGTYGEVGNRAKLSYFVVSVLLAFLASGATVAILCWCLAVPFLGLSEDMTGIVALVLCGLAIELCAGIVWLRLNVQDALANCNGRP
jgi:hypothetical protein